MRKNLIKNRVQTNNENNLIKTKKGIFEKINTFKYIPKKEKKNKSRINFQNRNEKKVKIFERINTFKYIPKNKEKKNKSGINLKKENKKISKICNIPSLLLFIVSYYFYYLSLEKCFEGEEACSKKWEWIMLKLAQLIISIIIIIFLILLIIFDKISKFHLIHFILVFICFYYYSHSDSFQDHGAFNLAGFFIIFFLFLLLFLILKILLLILKIKYKFFLFLSLLLLYNIPKEPMNCNDWAKGLNNTYIENDKNKYGCQIIFPKRCSYKIIAYTQDISKFWPKNCKNKNRNSKEKILKFLKSSYINSNTLKFGFPLTNNDVGKKDGIDDTVLKEYTSKNLIDMDKSLPFNLNRPEYIVDFSKDPLGEVTINLNFNETLSKERKKLEINSIPYSNNILLLYIDSVSRANALRKMKKTISFIDQFISYQGGHNKKNPNENFHSFQFFKYHSFRGVTGENYPILFYGNRVKAKKFVRINKYIKENGYITCFASEYCQKDNTRTRHELTDDELYDHQLVYCDPNVISFNSITKRCLYGNINSYYLYQYSEQFWRKYSNNRKFSVIILNDGHEGTLELIKYADDVIYNFLNSLFKDNLLKDTTIFLFSDHGCLMPSVYFLDDFYKIEFRLPMLFMIVNDRKNIDYNQQYFNIHENQQTFITGYDIYNTIGNIIYGDNYKNIKEKDESQDTPKSPIGKSLFEKINQKDRKPKKYYKMATNVCI